MRREERKNSNVGFCRNWSHHNDNVKFKALCAVEGYKIRMVWSSSLSTKVRHREILQLPSICTGSGQLFEGAFLISQQRIRESPAPTLRASKHIYLVAEGKNFQLQGRACLDARADSAQEGE